MANPTMTESKAGRNVSILDGFISNQIAKKVYCHLTFKFYD